MRVIDIINEMATLSRAQLLDPRTKWRADVLLKKVADGATVEIEEKVDGKIVRTPVKLDNSPEEVARVSAWLNDPAQQASGNLILATRNKKYPVVSLNKIAKGKDFGGEELASRERVEQGQIESINQHIIQNARKLGLKTISLKVGNRIVDAGGVFKATPGVKADAQIVDGAGNPVAWISLKDGPGPKAIAGWGGITHPPVVHHPEIQDFISQSQILFGKEGIPKATSMGREITDTTLKNQIIFGKKFGGDPGPSNVDAVMAGDIQIKKIDKDTFEIYGTDNTWPNGITPDGTFDPVLNISYKGDRDNAGIPGARISVQPIGGRRWDPIDGEIKKLAKKKPAKKANTKELPHDGERKLPVPPTKAVKPVKPVAPVASVPTTPVTPTVNTTDIPEEELAYKS
jgi:hypothetical protein